MLLPHLVHYVQARVYGIAYEIRFLGIALVRMASLVRTSGPYVVANQRAAARKIHKSAGEFAGSRSYQPSLVIW